MGARGRGPLEDPRSVFPRLSRVCWLSPHRYSPAGPQAVAVSAVLGHGLPELRARLEDAVLRATGRRVLTLRVRLAGTQLRCVGLARRGPCGVWRCGEGSGTGQAPAHRRAASFLGCRECGLITPGAGAGWLLACQAFPGRGQ